MKAWSVVAAIALVVACGGSPQKAAPDARSSGQPQQYGNLDQLLAPVALYPDQLLAQVLISASNPGAVLKLDEWLKRTTNASGSQLQDAAVKAGFEPSFVALAIFPQVVAKMASDIQWTTELGQAFTTNKSAVFDSIQRLRHQAQNVGTLKDTPQQDISTKTTSTGENVVVIEPANPQVVYVPEYNPTTVYTQAPSTTVVVKEDTSAEQAVAAGLIGFTAGIAIGAAMNNNYYYGPYGWYGGRAYMYNDGWDDYWDHREDARDDWMDHREDIMEERGDIAENRAENRSDVAQNRAENRSERAGTSQQQRTERQQNRQDNRPATQAQRQQRSAQTQSAAPQSRNTARTGSYEARGYSQGTSREQPASRSGSSDAFSGYSSGSSQRAASSRGQQSRSSARGSGGGRRR
jgi:hypothetical protein